MACANHEHNATLVGRQRPRSGHAWYRVRERERRKKLATVLASYRIENPYNPDHEKTNRQKNGGKIGELK